jgi:hypothetical protein
VYSGTEPTGIERRESFQDMRDLTDTAGLQARAANTLAEKNVTSFIDAKALTYSQLVLGTDYDLGDYITVEAYGQSENVQITKVKESWASGKYDVDLTFNRQYPEFPKQVQSTFQQLTQTNNNNEKMPENEFLLKYVYPIGCYYTQYPDASSNTDATEFPVSQRPATLFGGTWVEQWATESIFFRTRGTASDSGRSSGSQPDAFQGHRHRPSSTPINQNFEFSFSSGGLFTAANSGSVSTDNAPSTGNASVSDGTNGTPRTASETRPTNRRIKVWKRTA